LHTNSSIPALSLYHLLDPQVLADPYPLYHRLRTEAPVHWDPFLHAWVVTRFDDVMSVLTRCSSARTPTPEKLRDMGLAKMCPIAQLMVKQLIFLDPPSHTRLRSLSAQAFTPYRIKSLRDHIQAITDSLLDAVQPQGGMDVISELADPLPSIVTAGMLGVPIEDHRQLKAWSKDFAEMLGNFQHNPDRTAQILKTVNEMTAYFQSAIRRPGGCSRDGLISSLTNAEIEGDRLTEEEVIANCILIMVAGQETTTSLIANEILTLLRHPAELKRLCSNPSLIPSAVEEVLRYESPTHITARLTAEDTVLAGKRIPKGQAILAVIAAANRDPEHFPEPNRFDIARANNRHLAFGWGSHFCFGASLARLEAQIALETVIRRLPGMTLEPRPLTWRNNQGLRGLTALPIIFEKLEINEYSGATTERCQHG
jgi:cytochrome P450